MEDLCRLCLTISSPLSLQYLSFTLTQKIESVLPVQVIENDFLPKYVCSSCSDKVDEIHDFHLKVSANQNLLLRYLSDGVRNLNEFYSTLKNDFVKLETENKDGKLIETNTVSSVSIKQERDDDSSEEHIVYTNIPIENEELIKTENFKNEDIYSDANTSIPSENTVAKTKVPAKRKKQKVPAKRQKEKVPAKRKKEKLLTKIKQETEEKPKPRYGRGRKVEDREIKIEFENNSDDGLEGDDKNDKFKCLTCFDMFETQLDLLNHYRDDHTPDNESETTRCKYSKVKYKDEYRFKCEKCEYMHHVRWFIQRHVKSHTENRPFMCKMCGRTYKTAIEILNHGRAHTNAKMECYYRCGFSTAYKGALKNHEALHRAEYRYTCDECGKGFHTRSLVIEHKNTHQGVRPFVCDICGMAFYMSRYLQAHRSRLHPQSKTVKRYLCVHCSLPCDTMNSLNEHMKAEHERITDYLCDICGKKLASKDKLIGHKRIHQGIKPFECNICGKKLTRKSHLIVHENAHNKQRNFRCKCGKRYEQRSSLFRHQNTKCRHLYEENKPENPEEQDDSAKDQNKSLGLSELEAKESTAAEESQEPTISTKEVKVEASE